MDNSELHPTGFLQWSLSKLPRPFQKEPPPGFYMRVASNVIPGYPFIFFPFSNPSNKGNHDYLAKLIEEGCNTVQAEIQTAQGDLNTLEFQASETILRKEEDKDLHERLLNDIKKGSQNDFKKLNRKNRKRLNTLKLTEASTACTYTVSDQNGIPLFTLKESHSSFKDIRTRRMSDSLGKYLGQVCADLGTLTLKKPDEKVVNVDEYIRSCQQKLASRDSVPEGASPNPDPQAHTPEKTWQQSLSNLLRPLQNRLLPNLWGDPILDTSDFPPSSERMETPILPGSPDLSRRSLVSSAGSDDIFMSFYSSPAEAIHSGNKPSVEVEGSPSISTSTTPEDIMPPGSDNKTDRTPSPSTLSENSTPGALSSDRRDLEDITVRPDPSLTVNELPASETPPQATTSIVSHSSGLSREYLKRNHSDILFPINTQKSAVIPLEAAPSSSKGATIQKSSFSGSPLQSRRSFSDLSEIKNIHSRTSTRLPYSPRAENLPNAVSSTLEEGSSWAPPGDASDPLQVSQGSISTHQTGAEFLEATTPEPTSLDSILSLEQLSIAEEYFARTSPSGEDFTQAPELLAQVRENQPYMSNFLYQQAKICLIKFNEALHSGENTMAELYASRASKAAQILTRTNRECPECAYLRLESHHALANGAHIRQARGTAPQITAMDPRPAEHGTLPYPHHEQSYSTSRGY